MRPKRVDANNRDEYQFCGYDKQSLKYLDFLINCTKCSKESQDKTALRNPFQLNPNLWSGVPEKRRKTVLIITLQWSSLFVSEVEYWLGQSSPSKEKEKLLDLAKRWNWYSIQRKFGKNQHFNRTWQNTLSKYIAYQSNLINTLGLV